MDVKKPLIVRELTEIGGLMKLATQVESALDAADAMSLSFVALDLCSALEKLKELQTSLYPDDFS